MTQLDSIEVNRGRLVGLTVLSDHIETLDAAVAHADHWRARPPMCIIVQMDAKLSEFLVALVQCTTALLIVLNPLGLVPIIASMTGALEPPKQRRIIRQSVLIGSALLLIFTFAGTGILSIFKIRLYDLQVAGGLLLLSIAFSFVLKGNMSTEAKSQKSPSAAPIASPILVGPGAITTAVVLVGKNGPLVTSLAVAIASFVTWIVFRSSPRVYRVLGESGADVIVRIMGILLAAIAVVYVRQGVVEIIRATTAHRL